MNILTPRAAFSCSPSCVPVLLISIVGCTLFLASSVKSPAQEVEPMARFALDSDHDGMSDALEQALLVQSASSVQQGVQRLLHCGRSNQNVRKESRVIEN